VIPIIDCTFTCARVVALIRKIQYFYSNCLSMNTRPQPFPNVLVRVVVSFLWFLWSTVPPIIVIIFSAFICHIISPLSCHSLSQSVTQSLSHSVTQSLSQSVSVGE
jgi:hypothetical protein